MQVQHLKNYWLRPENILIMVLVLIKLVIHFMLSANYGYFRDEFLYMNLGERLFEGSLDMPLLAPTVMTLTRWLLGDSLLAIRFFPVMAGVTIIFLTVLMVRELGGKFFAQLLAGICVLGAPVFLGVNSSFSYDSFDQLFWTWSLLMLVKIFKNNSPRHWLYFGLTAGLGLLTKQSMLFLGFALALALMLTPQRKQFQQKWIWLGAAVALLFFIPYLIMQWRLDWPSLGYWKYYTDSKTYPVSPIEFLLFQIIPLNPLALPVWLSGLGWSLFSKSGKAVRPLGLIYVLLFFIFMLLKAKFYFLAPVYPFLFAAGAVAFEQFSERGWWLTIRKVYVGLIVVGAIIMAPFAMPLLPVETFIKYSSLTGGDAGVKQERHEISALPQFFADRFGWEEMADVVARVYHQLPAEEQKKACILTGNYGEAGAIKFFGEKNGYALPPVISGHGQYFYWGFGNCTGEVIISIGISERYLKQAFQEVISAGLFQCQYCMPYENNQPVFVCRRPVAPLAEMWPHFKHLD